MKILVLETSTLIGSVAIIEKKLDRWHCLAEQQWQRVPSNRSTLKTGSHSESVISLVQNILLNHHLGLSDLQGFATSVGPGSFTGIRVGINVVKTLAYTQNKPVFICSSLALLAAENLRNHTKVYTLMNAHKNLIYFSEYEKRHETMVEVQAPQVIRPSEIKLENHGDMAVVGDGLEVFADEISIPAGAQVASHSRTQHFPLARSFAEVLSCGPDLFKKTQWNEVNPLYIRASEAEEKMNAGEFKL